MRVSLAGSTPCSTHARGLQTEYGSPSSFPSSRSDPPFEGTRRQDGNERVGAISAAGSGAGSFSNVSNAARAASNAASLTNTERWEEYKGAPRAA